MIALLLGFTFSMAISRYDARRRLVFQEANAIGTTYLRASLLPAGHEVPVRDALRQYVNVRLDLQKNGRDPDRVAEGLSATADIHRTLWKHAEDAARQAPSAITSSFVVTLNDLIDTDTERVAAARAQIPGGVWFLLTVVAACGCLMTGYRSGVDDTRNGFANILLPLLITFVIIIIFDLASPLRGLIGVSQQPMIDLQRMMGS
jgi:hypothetical protein